ncbi:hypothetical protein BDF21DRAFT_393382 [Thamnidium elegans]|nr:hypothetical protein BDF21DRAFT_393382 [Thamnidium elegans]
MLSSQRSLSALSINTNTTHGDMMRRNSSATTANRHRRLQTPNNVPPLPLSAASNASLSPEELSSKIADSFQQFSSMLSQLSNNKTATNNNAATPVTPPPSSSNYPTYILSPQKQQLSPRHIIPAPSQRSNLLNSPPLSSSNVPSTATQNNHRKEVRLSSQPTSVVIQPKVPSSINPTQLQNQLSSSYSSTTTKKSIEPEEEEIDMEAYHSHAIYFKTALDHITATPIISQGNTELRRRLISKWLTRAASIGDLETMQQMLDSIQDIDINCTDDKKTGITCLMYASYFGHLQCLDLLLSHPSIKINQQDKKGWTALMWAINSYQTEIVQKLLSRGAKKTLQTRRGRSIYSYPTSDTVKELLGTPPLTKPTQIISTEKTQVDPTDENSRRKSNDNSAGNIEHFYQTSVDGYSHFLKNSRSAAVDPRRKSAPIASPLSPPDFSQLTKAITTPQQEQRNKENALNTLIAAEDTMEEEEDMKRWETSIKSSNTFSWNQCLPDQMFVFSQEDLSFIVEQALTVTDIKSLMNKTQLSNELWQPANIIFLSTRFAYYCSSRELLNLLLRTVAAKLSKIIKYAYRDTQSLAYWIANMCQLSSYLKKDPGLSISTHESQETLSELIAEAYAFFVTESQKKLEKILDASMLDYESIQEVEQVDFVDDWQRFFRRSNGSRRSTDTISSVERKSSMDFSSSQTSIDSSSSPQSITKLLTQIQSTLQAYHVPPAIVIQAMAQFFHYLSCELFNRVLTYKKYLCRSKALQLRMNLSGIEEWVRASHLPASLYSAFEPLIQLLQLLQCLSQMNDIVLFSSTIQTFDKLNPLQVKRCVQTYRYEVSEVKLPESVEQLANQMAFDHQQQLAMVSNSRRNSSSSNSSGMVQRSGSIDLSNNLPTGRPTSISSLNCLLTTTTNKKRLSSEEMLSLNSTMVQQLDDVDDLHDEGEEKRNSKYLLPFSIPVTTALLQGWTDEKQKNSANLTTNYSDAIYQEIKRKKQEQFNLLDKIYPAINEEWVFNLDKRLHVR